ncbi:hypothetical protein GCM10010872_38150 [Dyella flava]|nr:hypothetical protein GCM10010872_38150 [Dyella flava]
MKFEASAAPHPNPRIKSGAGSLPEGEREPMRHVGERENYRGTKLRRERTNKAASADNTISRDLHQLRSYLREYRYVGRAHR